MPRLRRIEVRGFRAFGTQPQVLELRGPLAVVWGPNSQGKTSLAEAVEFLLTGRTVRREFLASAAREFAGSLRNAHLRHGEPVFVRAHVLGASGTVHTVERRLVSDYTGRDECTSELQIDGQRATDVSTIGIRLSQPPLEAPVLMQHSLRYVVSAEPQKRADYFKALLEVSDLEDIRTAIAEAKRLLEPALNSIGAALNHCLTNKTLAPVVSRLQAAKPSAGMISSILRDALRVVLSDTGTIPESLEERLATAKQLLASKREATFPVQVLSLEGVSHWSEPSDEMWVELDEFVRLRAAMTEGATRLVRLFEYVLALPGIVGSTAAVDCPVCEAPGALTPARISAMRDYLDATEAFQGQSRRVQSTLQSIRRFTDECERYANRSRPAFLDWSDAERKRRGFTEERMQILLVDRASDLVPHWRDANGHLASTSSEVKRLVTTLRQLLDKMDMETVDLPRISAARQIVEALVGSLNQLALARSEYSKMSEPLILALRAEVDKQGHMEGWQDLLDLVEQREQLLSWLLHRSASLRVSRELEEAVEEVDVAKARVLDDKFAQLGNDIATWWSLMRPDQLTSFHGVQRGATGRRFVDLKARLASGPNGSSSFAVRDAVAVFSDSQLNCLGLSAFLARTGRDGSGFVLLDDPVPASDDEHRAMFVSYVLPELMRRNIQVLLVTHDERIWKDVQETYKHMGIDAFVISMQDPALGAVVEDRGDTFDSMLARAAPYILNQSPEIRKQFAARPLRDATERFCKLLLIKERYAQGDALVAVSDYGGQNLDTLIGKVERMLTRDPSHVSKLRRIGAHLNPGSHDDRVPAPGDLQVCYRSLKELGQAYLSGNGSSRA
jgi:hypothetical protein